MVALGLKSRSVRARGPYSYLYTPPEGALPTRLGDMPLLISGGRCNANKTKLD